MEHDHNINMIVSYYNTAYSTAAAVVSCNEREAIKNTKIRQDTSYILPDKVCSNYANPATDTIYHINCPYRVFERRGYVLFIMHRRRVCAGGE